MHHDLPDFRGTRPGDVIGYRRDGRPIYLIAGGDGTVGRLAEIDQRLEAIRTELLTFADRDLDETETTRFGELETEFETLETEREPLARRAATIERVRSTVRTATARGRGLEPGGADRSPALNVRTDPYEDLDQVRTRAVAAADLRARALNAIEQAPADVDDDARERATRLIERGDRHGRIARHMLLTGSPAYQRAFEAVLGGMQPWQLEAEELEALRFADEHRRAINEGTGAAGAFLVPFHLDPTIMLTNAGSTNPFRQIARTETITTNEWHGVSSAGVTAQWRAAEATQVPDNSPTFAQPFVHIHSADAYLQASFEATMDTNIASQVGMLLADAKDNLEATAFAVGTGVNQPFGVVTAVAAVAGSRVTGGASYDVADVYAVKDAIPARWRSRASWVANDSIYSLTRQFASGTGPQHAFWADLGMDRPPLLLGRPAYESSAMDGTLAAASTNDILLAGDFSNYLIVDRVGMTVAYEPLVKGANQRPTGEVGWYAFWRVGANVLIPDAFRVLRVVVP
ncbi:phage major capsid protein [Nonomuraea sp. CA-141351]|uniref:phage major capsid protein n=1 Tax=Nonomuraea sp. CA-141351 TaxID=3239996 RepID=UPI003D923C91